MLFKESFEGRRNRVINNTTSGMMQDDIPVEHLQSLKEYKLSSSKLNRALINGDELSVGEKLTHDNIKRYCHPAGKEMRLYSGTGHDFGKMASQSKDGVIHSPAHISTSHSLDFASVIAVDKVGGGDDKELHMLHIKVKPTDKIMNFDSRLPLSHEKEAVIPAGTKLKYSHTTDHMIPTHANRRTGEIGYKKPFKVHHFTIHSQE